MSQQIGGQDRKVKARKTSHLRCGILVPFMAACWLGSVAAAAAQGKCGPTVGFTLTHLHVDTSKEAECLELGTGTAETRVSTLHAADNIVQSYADPNMRAAVKSDIAQMVVQGATAMRTILWFYLAEDEKVAQKERNNPNSAGMVEATAGKLPDAIVSNLVQLISDAKSAGISRYIVSMGSQGTQNPKCRAGGDQAEWGNCYDPSLFKYSWTVTEQVAKALKSPRLSGIDVLIDIAPEGCFDPSLRTLLDRNLKDHASQMISHYRDEFGDRQFITSCGGGRSERSIRGLQGMEQLYMTLHTRPAAVDLHVYDKNQQDIAQMLEAADAAAKRLGVPMEIGETNIDHPYLFGTIHALLSNGKLASLRNVLVFPRRAASKCQIDVQAPYNIAAVRAAMGLQPYPSNGTLCLRPN